MEKQNFVELAKAYIKNGISVIPVNSTKMPSIRNWGKYQVVPPTDQECEEMFSSCWGFAVLCGGKSNLVCFDFDLKYSLSRTLWEDIKLAIPRQILDKAYVQSTKNAGFHMVFEVPPTRLFGNEKLASRYTTEYEKDETYRDAFKNPETRSKALKMAMNDDRRVLIETRSGTSVVSGGYYVAAPSPGYKHIFGKINKLSEEEYDLLDEVLRTFNEVVKVDKTQKLFSSGDWEVSPFDHYNREGDVAQVLIDNGWTIGSESSQNINFKRPGSSPTFKSGIFDKTSRIFSCFSTSTIFDTQKSYNPVGVLSVLEFEEDFSRTFSYLVERGWGIKNK